MSFDDLLESARSRSAMPENYDCLKDALFQLMSHNHRSQDVIQEGRPESLSSRPDLSACSFSVVSLQRSLEEQSTSMAVPVAMVTADLLASQLKSADSDDAPLLLLTDTQRNEMNLISAVILRVSTDYNRNVFIKVLNKECELPLEALWRLHNSDVMRLDTFITCNLSKPRVIGKLSSGVVSLCESGATETRDLRHSIVQTLVQFLVTQAYSEVSVDDAASKGMKKVCCALLESITKKLLSSAERPMDINVYSTVLLAPPGELDGTSLKRYCSRQLTVMLSLNPVYKVSQALQRQSEWSFTKANPLHTQSISELLTVLSAEEAVSLLQEILEQHEVNWQLLLTYCSVVIVCYRESPPLLSDLIGRLLSDAIEASEQDGIISGFLLARQACGEGSHVFPAYQDWFQKTFGDPSTSPAANRKSFMFLIKFLTNIVPYESPQFLKTHLLKPPYVPPKCRPILGDYVTLAKTMLADLKESLDDLGIYEDSSSVDKDKALEQSEGDVNKALQSYGNTGKVPANIMEASIFRKPYFVGRFLPSLLRPRPLPDAADMRMRFIEALHRADKIPESLYKAYRKGCDKMAAQLLEGVFSDEEEDMDLMLLSPWQQLLHSLSSLRDAVLQDQSANQKTGVSSHISLLSEKIANVLSSTESDTKSLNSTRDLHVDMSAPNLNKLHVQVCDEVLHTLCEIDLGLDDLTSDCQDCCHDYRLQSLVMMASHGRLWTTFCVRILELITKQYSTLESYHIQSLAVTLVHVVTYWEMLPQLVFHDGARSEAEPLLDYILQVTSPCCKHRMKFLLQLCYYYIHCAYTSFSGVRLNYTDAKEALLPQKILAMFIYLYERLVGSGDQDNSHSHDQLALDAEFLKRAHTLYHTRAFSELAKDNRLSLTEWATMEYRVIPSADALNYQPRHDYLSQQLLSVYLDNPAPDSRGRVSHAATCLTTLCDALLDNFVRVNCDGPEIRRDTVDCHCGQQPHESSHAVLLLVLQQLVTMVTVCDESPWLPAYLIQRVQAPVPPGEEDDQQPLLSSPVLSSFQLVKSLSPHLLFSNNIHVKPRVTKDADSVTIINNIWRNNMTIGAVLSFDCTLYILQAVLHSSCLDHDDLVADVLQHCPVFLPSVVVHWCRLQPAVAALTNHGDVKIGTSLYKLLTLPRYIHTAVTRLLSRELHVSECEEFLHEDLWLLGVGLAAHLTRSPETIDQWQPLWVDLFTEESTNQEAGIACLLFLLADMCWQCLYQKEVPDALERFVSDIWRQFPSSLVTCVQTVLPSLADKANKCCHLVNTFPDVSKKLVCVAFANVLMRMSKPDLVGLCAVTGVLGTVLGVYVACMELYDSFTTSKDLQQSSEISQPLPMCKLSRLSSLVKSVLHLVPKSQQQFLPQILAAGCLTDISVLVEKMS